MIFNELSIDTNEVLEAADTKWNFNKFNPGLVGGHCIGVDPYYLSFKAQEVGRFPDLILTARKINNGMGKFIAEQTEKVMIQSSKTIFQSNILVLGATFKEDCPDLRNSQVIYLIESLQNLGANVDLYDPWINLHEVENTFWANYVVSNPFGKDKKYDGIIVAVGHKAFKALSSEDFESLFNGKKVIIDVKNIIQNPSWRL